MNVQSHFFQITELQDGKDQMQLITRPKRQSPQMLQTRTQKPQKFKLEVEFANGSRMNSNFSMFVIPSAASRIRLEISLASMFVHSSFFSDPGA